MNAKVSSTDRLVSPSGEVFEVHSIRKFCREHSLDVGNVYKVIYGTRQHHKGWTNEIAPCGFVSKPQNIEKYLNGEAANG